MPPQSLCSTQRGPGLTQAPCGMRYRPRFYGLASKVLKCFRGEMMLLWLWLSATKIFHFFLTAKVIPLSPKTCSCGRYHLTLHWGKTNLIYWLKLGRGLWKVGRSSLPYGIWPENHWFTEAQRSEGTFPKSHNKSENELTFNLGSLAPNECSFPLHYSLFSKI